MGRAFHYIQDHPLMTEDDYPYKGKAGSCKYKEQFGVGKVSSWNSVTKGSQADLQGALMKGPVSVAVDSSSLNFKYYKEGIITDTACGNRVDHGVLAIGFGSHNGQDYYIVKNSWGKHWGDHGFVRIGAQKHGEGICGIQNDPVIPMA